MGVTSGNRSRAVLWEEQIRTAVFGFSGKSRRREKRIDFSWIALLFLV